MEVFKQKLDNYHLGNVLILASQYWQGFGFDFRVAPFQSHDFEILPCFVLQISNQ